MGERQIIGRLAVALFVVAVATGGACPSSEQSLLDELKFALDRCNPVSEPASLTTFCQTAVDKGELLIAEAPTDKNARILLSNAYFGRSGLDFLDLLQTFADLSSTAADDFEEIRDALTGVSVDLTKLRLSVTTLTDLTGLAAADNEDYFRQLGLMRSLEAFVRPVKQSVDDANAFNEAKVVEKIDADEAAIIEEDYLNADNNLADTEVDDDDILSPIRENYCRCSLQNPLGGSAGFNAACLRDLMRCELNPNVGDTSTSTINNAGIAQDYNRDGALDDRDCATLLDPTGLSACGGQDTD